MTTATPLTCCCEAAPFGDHCDPCERGGHEYCTNKMPMPNPDPIEDELPPADLVGPDPDLVDDPAPQPSPTPRPSPIKASSPDSKPEYQRGGVWVVCHTDFSMVRIFEEEIDALRAANKAKAECLFVPFGSELKTVLEES